MIIIVVALLYVQDFAAELRIFSAFSVFLEDFFVIVSFRRFHHGIHQVKVGAIVDTVSTRGHL